MNVIFDQQANRPVFPLLQPRHGSRGLLIYGIYELDNLRTRKAQIKIKTCLIAEKAVQGSVHVFITAQLIHI